MSRQGYTPTLDANTVKQFRRSVWSYYRRHGRHELPWRQTSNPFHVLVSEVMLQQTQVDRVIPKYLAFLQRFPTTRTLARASLAEVLVAWQGLGYNRRAKLLWETVRVIETEHSGRFPSTYDGLRSLPGIGPYTAGAVLAFAYNVGVPLLETDIRAAYLHHFWPGTATAVTDRALMARVAETLPPHRAREWYAALMDYGVYIKQTFDNPTTRAQSYRRQSTFKGSDREVRGAIVRSLAAAPTTRVGLHRALTRFSSSRIDTLLLKLTTEGLVMQQGRRFKLPTGPNAYQSEE